MKKRITPADPNRYHVMVYGSMPSRTTSSAMGKMPQSTAAVSARASPATGDDDRDLPGFLSRSLLGRLNSEQLRWFFVGDEIDQSVGTLFCIADAVADVEQKLANFIRSGRGCVRRILCEGNALHSLCG